MGWYLCLEHTLECGGRCGLVLMSRTYSRVWERCGLVLMSRTYSRVWGRCGLELAYSIV